MIKKQIPTYWHRSVNFGDCIAPYLLEKITGFQSFFVSNTEETEHIALIGSLLDNGPLNNTHVWGCGFAYEDSPVYPPKKIYAIRGKLSRSKYLEANIECPDILGDPALLLPRFYNPEIQKKYKVGVIPHVMDYISVLENYANRYEGFVIIDLSKPVEFVINQILSCEKIISSSLHGLIVADAYGISSRWVEFSDKVLGNGFKFRDYYSGMINSGGLLDVEPLDLKSFPCIKDIESEIFFHKTILDLDMLLASCPLTETNKPKNMNKNLLEGEHLIMPFQDQAFNGDTYMMEKFLELKNKFNIKTAIELGSAVGGTTKWLCENFDEVITIEINPEYRNVCLKRVQEYGNVQCLLGSTVDLLADVLTEITLPVIFHIDSHWANNNPLLEELEIIRKSGLKPVIEIHDFKVPGRSELGFDVYGKIVYEWAWIKEGIESIYGVDGFIIEYNTHASGAMRGAIYILPK